MIEGKEILAKIEEAERGQLRLGELADQLETQYGERTLAKFAKELDIAACTLARYRDVYRIGTVRGFAPRGAFLTRSSVSSHPTLPNPSAIRANPNITKRTAQDLKRKLDSGGRGRGADN